MISIEERGSWQALCDLDWVKDAFTLSEDLVNFFEVKTVRFWKQEIHSCEPSQITLTSQEGLGCLHGSMRKKLVHAKTRKYRHPIVEKAVGVTSATMKLCRVLESSRGWWHE